MAWPYHGVHKEDRYCKRLTGLITWQGQASRWHAIKCLEKGICSGGHLIWALAFLIVLPFGLDCQEQKGSLGQMRMPYAWLWE